MLHLSTRAARRAGASYLCARCLAISNPSSISPTAVSCRVASIPLQNDRSLCTTSPRAAPAAESQPSPADTPPGTLTSSTSPPSPPSSSPKKKKKKPKKPAEKKGGDDAQPDAQRQLHVLQGALDALRNVLAAQNIDVSSIITASNKKTDGNEKKQVEKKQAAQKQAAEKPKPQAKSAKSTKGTKGTKEVKENTEYAKKNTKEDPASPQAKEDAKQDPKQDPKQDAEQDAKQDVEQKAGTPQKPPEKRPTMKKAHVAALRKALAVNAAAALTPAVTAQTPDVTAQTPAVTAQTPAVTAQTPAVTAQTPASDGDTTNPTPKKRRVAKKSASVQRTKFQKPARTPKQARAKAWAKASTSSDRPEDKDEEDAAVTSEDPTSSSSLEKVPYSAIGTTAKPRTTQSKKTKGKKEKSPLAISKIDSADLYLRPIDVAKAPIPGLSYGLERVLFNPGVYYLQDPRSRVFNFDPYLSKIMPLQEFDFNALKQYVTSSKDLNLISIAKEHNKRYTGSTSSMTSMLSHFHYLISSWRNINVDMLSRSIVPDSVQFTRINRAPAAIFLHWKDGTYAIDADKEFDTANILSMLGKSMEKLLTLPKEDYERYRHVNSDQITEEERNAAEAFHFTGFEDFMMRSQLDAHDPRVPGTGMFDLKTRAVVSIRMDAKGFEKGLGYEIRNSLGQWSSFEREYYDMMRSAFMKYSLQVRMGRMDGIFVAFHNTQRIFGFQYISLQEMDLSLHGTNNTSLGNREFKFSLSLLNKILNKVTKKFPERSLRLHFETRTSVGSPFMYIFAKPVEAKDIDEVQSASRASIEAFERTVLGINNEVEEEAPTVNKEDVVDVEEVEDNEPPKSQEMESLAAWDEVRQTVEEAMEDDEDGVGIVREAIEDALEQSGLIRARSSEEARDYVDSLLTAITGTEKHRSAAGLSNTISEDAIAEDEDGTTTVDDIVVEEAEESEEAEEAEDASDMETEAETPNGAQASEASEESSSPAAVVQETDADQLPNFDISQTLEPTSHETGALTGNREDNEGVSANVSADASADASADVSADVSVDLSDDASDDISDDTESSLSASETTSEDQITAISPVESKDVEQDEKAATQEEEEEELDEDEEITESKDDATSASDMSPLKDLIVRMAQRIDKRPILEENTDSSLNDSSKLKAFERILGEMMSRAKVVESEQEPSSPGSESSGADDIQSNETAEAAGGNTGAVDAASKGSTKRTKKTDSEKPGEGELDLGELMGLVLTIKNKVNDQYVERPENLTKNDSWVLEYNIEELPDPRAHRFYSQCLARRRKTLADVGDKDSEWYKMFRGDLERHTQKGRDWRAREEERSQRLPVHVVDRDEPLQWVDVFGEYASTVTTNAPSEGVTQNPAGENRVLDGSVIDEDVTSDSIINEDVTNDFVIDEDATNEDATDMNEETETISKEKEESGHINV